jgi:hypothetical protein
MTEWKPIYGGGGGFIGGDSSGIEKDHGFIEGWGGIAKGGAGMG